MIDIAAIAKVAAQQQPMPKDCAPPVDSKRVVHIDGDYAAYYCAGGDDMDPGTARWALLKRIENAKKWAGAGKVIVHLTTSGSTKGDRFLIATVLNYQEQRTHHRPKNWPFLREFMETYVGDKFEVKMWNTREADDGIAYVAHWSASFGHEAVIHTADKDMRMLPGVHLSWAEQIVVPVPMGAYEVLGADGLVYGHKWFWLQMLQGDGADNIPGLPQIANNKGNFVQCGKKNAEALLKGTTDNEEAYHLVSGAYSAYYGDEWRDRFVEQAALLWLRTDRHANVGDFMQIMPGSDALRAAVAAMVDRIEADKKQLRELGHGA